jgi:pyrrolidone-carboxylate peptidase
MPASPTTLGGQPVDTPVVVGGPAAYFSSLPIKAMLQALQKAGVAAEVSQTAGTFVCNHVFYALMHALATKRGFKAHARRLHPCALCAGAGPAQPAAGRDRARAAAGRGNGAGHNA